MSGHLPEQLFEHVLLPVASEADARTARKTILPYLEDVGGVATVAHVVKTTEGSIDPSPASMQEADAERLFDVVSDGHDHLLVEMRTAYGADVAETLFDLALEVGASAIVFSPKKKNRLVRLLTGDTALSLVTEPEVPVLSIPRPDG